MGKFNKKVDPYAKREACKYKNPIPSREFILQFLNEDKRPSTRSQMIQAFGLNKSDEKEALRRRLVAMVRDGQLLKNRKGAYGLLENMELIAGRVIGHKDGFGFVVSDKGGDDLFIGARQMRAVLHGDRVLARIAKMDPRGRREAIIVEVIERGTKQLVGRYFEKKEVGHVEPANYRMNQNIIIPQIERNNAKNGQIVVVAIIEQPTLRSQPIGKIIEVLGDHMAPGMEINVAIRNHELPTAWPDAVLREIAPLSKDIPHENLKTRTDLRSFPFLTIDGHDAKDFDDAVYCEPQAEGQWRLFVAIADVSHYVASHSALDQEAYKRGNSVYFPGRVIPMLPEILSNHLCSLSPLADRLVLVCEMHINSEGEMISYCFYNGVIHSHARLTYHQVHRLIERQDKTLYPRFQSLIPHLTHLYQLFNLLITARQKRGAIDFNIPETKILFSHNRKIKKIIPYERFNAHRVIEECMLCANTAAAAFLIQYQQPALYRIHEGPSKEKLHDLQCFLRELELSLLNQKEKVTPLDYAKLLRILVTRPDANIIQMMLLRSLSQAIYSPENRGHFGLAYSAYTHFTSPIRRYPDLIIHRVIKSTLAMQKKRLKKRAQLFTDTIHLQRLGEHCSMTERRADDATREVMDWLKCEFMLDKVGQEFIGYISSVTGFGLFVTLNTVYVEGLVHISLLPNDYYHFDMIKQALIGKQSGRTFRIGQPLSIKVARVNLDQREIDFVLSHPVPSGVKQ